MIVAMVIYLVVGLWLAWKIFMEDAANSAEQERSLWELAGNGAGLGLIIVAWFPLVLWFTISGWGADDD